MICPICGASSSDHQRLREHYIACKSRVEAAMLAWAKHREETRININPPAGEPGLNLHEQQRKKFISVPLTDKEKEALTKYAKTTKDYIEFYGHG